MSVEEEMTRAVEDVLRSQPGTERLVLDSPPGAGKTGVIEHLAAQAVGLHRERVMIATQTKNQAIDLAGRIARGWTIPVYLLWSKRVPKPTELDGSGVHVLHSVPTALEAPHVVVATADKWAWVTEIAAGHYDLQVVEEAYQMRDAKWRLFAHFGRRHVLVGDPGQIDPVVTVDVEAWEDAAQPPHRSAPANLLARDGDGHVRRMLLPASRRVPGESAELVSSLMYGDLQFVPTSRHPERALEGLAPVGGPLGRALAAIEAGSSLVGVETVDRFETVVAALAAVHGARLVDADLGVDRAATDADTGVVCGPVVDVQAVLRRCGAHGWAETRAETADRWQGLERSFVVVMHPLWGDADAGFALDAGRWSVMLSRHRVACLVVAPPDTRARLGTVNVLSKRFGPPTSLERGVVVHSRTVEELDARGAWFAETEAG